MSQNTELEILNRVGRLAHSNSPLDERLQQITKEVTTLTYVQACSIHIQKEQGPMLIFFDGISQDQLAIAQKELVPQQEGVSFDGDFFSWKCLQPMSLIQKSSERGRPVYQSVIVTPLENDYEQCSGAIVLWSYEHREVTDDEHLMLSTLASQVFAMIKNTRLHIQLERRLEEQTRIYEVGKALSSTINLDELLDLISKTSVELTHSRGCVLRLLNREQTMLEIKSSYGDIASDVRTSARPVGEGIAGKVAEMMKAIKLDEITPELKESEVIESISHSLICVPIIGKEGVIGTIASFDKYPQGDEHRFSDEDVNLLTSFAGNAAVAIEHARFYERMEELALDNLLRLRELSILYHINTAMRSTIKLSRLLRIILTGVTIGGGLGFNRAILLMVNTRAQTLRGMLGIGPGSGQEANQIWQEQGYSQKSLVEMIVEVQNEEPTEETSFEKIAKSIWMPLAPEQGIFARTVLEKRSFNITDIHEFPDDCYYIANLLEIDRFATVPLIVRDQVIGIIYVDNKYNNVPISEDELNFLQMFANQAALAIDNAILYSNVEKHNQELREAQDRLVQMEKMTALGKMAADIAHEIRNPLICVGGFARRLLKDEDLPEKHKKYVNIISEESIRLETILQDVLVFSKETQVRFEPSNVNAIIKSSLELLALEIQEREVEVNTCFFKDLDTIMADTQQLKQIFINLLTNALQQVADKKGLINIMTYNTLSLNGGVTIEVSDNGGGIAPESIDNIFNPFFTTKGSGTGLGLAIIRKIIENHRGNINVRNRPGVGVTFVINFPIDPRNMDER
ncbi:hypothetical protein CSA56_10010 [candidate division KSB3 bacterium]|uniref:histidine kinase n=1 Tax=candidate division KSB3 bacterium TaxID=2044937 RepID=A0A2G6KDW0_9BACT|nr:MAG: hypothetical protein CSA56_10010 [candidate division KSB3 bacterium]